MADHSALNIGGLIAMMFTAPNKHAEAVELIRFQALRNRGPQPVLLGHVAILHVAKREERSDPMTFGVLGHVVRNSHDQHTCQHPTGLAILSPDQTPIIHWNRRSVL